MAKFLCAVLFLVGFCVLGYGVHSSYRGWRSHSWPAVGGRLSECRLQKNGGKRSTWEVKVRYSYSVAGKEYEGRCVTLGYSASDAYAAHQAIYDKLQPASRVMVRYHLRDPAVSVLAPGHHGATYMILFALTWLSLSGLSAVVLASEGLHARILGQVRILR